MKRILILIAVTLNLTGCASRDYYQDNSFTPVFNLYNRNYVVAAPTRVGNYLCGFPFFWVSAGVEAISPNGIKSEAYESFVNGIYLVPATVCGAIIGTVFIPFSYICAENPWYENFNNYYREWSCSKPVGGPYIRKTNKQIISQTPHTSEPDFTNR